MNSIPNSARKKVMLALCVATFLAAIEGTIVSTAMPAITGELNGMKQYSWIVSIYLLMTVISTPIYGKLADLYGRKRMFIAGASIFLLGSALSGAAQTMNELIAFRAVQGLGAGSLATIPFTIIGDLYSFEKRAKVQGWMSSIWGIAGISGPLMGGLLVDYVSWRSIFYLNLPVGLAAMILLALSLKENFEKKKHHIDYPGILTFTIGMFCLLYALELLHEESGGGTNWALIISLFAVAAISLALFYLIEKRSPEPMIPLQLFRIRTISMANLDSFIICVINVVIIFYLPLWIQGVFGKTATFSGIAMMPLSLGWPLGSIVAGNAMAKHGMRRLALAGSFFVIAACLGFTFMDAQTPVVWMMVCTFLAGMSFGLSLTSFTVSVQSAVSWELRGAAVASNNFIRTFGQTVGIAIFSLLLNTGATNSLNPDLLSDSLHQVFMVITVLSAVVLLVSFGLPKKAAIAAAPETAQTAAAKPDTQLEPK
ncbi:MDR family MFS transporter [Paenibacillus protaetiae]|uniref:MFS transporter n=1 Tax=Paenibacillus protaetiae TaxID=2509456 RepID=A0A4P6F5M6_9BACL|nr:MDR family MFS transporter [Paenibacillus protaetiae]QAY65708.1 MFS transporter [Paenibacillus protaetiae]